MTTTTQGKLGVYTTHQRGDEDSRETDMRAILSCTSRLDAARKTGESDMKAYAEAIRTNQRLWTMFQVALCDPDNALPRDLKLTLLSLSRYIDRVSLRAAARFAPQLLTQLIDINRTIAAGLAKKPPAAVQQAPTATTAAPPPPPMEAPVSFMTTA